MPSTTTSSQRPIAIDGLYRVEAPHYCAGFIIEGGIVEQAAPVIQWLIGKRRMWVVKYLSRKGFKVEYIND